ncbi:MAG: Asp-tRNA(Asn)/Glu-tRNA(Gln) amidotransferase subunit GatC [Amoebophilaceae bacterium]|nr:Asp-tRNA(Asn)/Glu-tRNA(Gln) amidotransferase subunit GatC [Amoebophilaceae bacterium]
MIIDNGLMKKLAHLVRIEFTEEELGSMLHDLNEMVGWLNQLDELLIKNESTIDQPIVLQADDLRKDLPLNTITHEEALGLAPCNDSNYFKVPHVKK